MRYSFTIKDNNEKSYRTFIWFLFFLHIVAAGIFVLQATDNKVRLSLYILLGFYALLSSLYLSFRNHPKAFETFSLVLALLYANFWFQHVGIAATIIFGVIFLAVSIVQGKRTQVLFTGEGIHLTRVFKTVVFPWQAMSNVILKDDILTIDFKSNKIIQVELAENNLAVDESEFNTFCTRQLNGGDSEQS